MSINVTIFDTADCVAKIDYVVLISSYQNRLLMVRHKARSTWEFPGGHVESGETVLEAACREMYEETGVVEHELTKLFPYRVEQDGKASHGWLFFSAVHALGAKPESEIAECKLLEVLPDELTYGEIYKVIIPAAESIIAKLGIGKLKQKKQQSHK